MNPHLVILPFSRKRYQSANWLVFVNIRKRNFFYSVASHHIRIHSGFLCTLTQFAQVFRLNSVYIHKMYHCHHSKEKEWKGKGRFYRETGFFYLLFINLLTDSLPAIALGLEPHNDRVMHDKPRPRSEGILTKPFLLSVGLEGLVIAAATIIAFHLGLNYGGQAAGATMAFSTLCLSRLYSSPERKSDHTTQSIFRATAQTA